MDLSRSVLVVIDMQRGFLNEQSSRVIPTAVDLVARWQRAGGTTIFTRYFNYPGSNFERLIHWTKLQGPPETDITPELATYAARATAIVDKTGYTLFSDDGAAAVEAGGWTDLVICGVATESCVLKTAVDAFERGLTPWVVEDASYSHAGEEAHQAGLLVARRFIGRGQILKSVDILDGLPVAA